MAHKGQKSCQKLHKILSKLRKIFPKITQNLSKNYTKSLQKLHKICQKLHKILSKLRKILSKITQNLSKLRKRVAQSAIFILSVAVEFFNSGKQNKLQGG